MKKIFLIMALILTCVSGTVFANELVFEPVGGGKFIYCNNPEGIKDDTIINGSSPKWIMNNEGLNPDLYYIYLSHFNYTGEGGRGYDIELDMAMTAKEDSEIIIHKAFFETPQNFAYYENWNKKISETSWGHLKVCTNMLGIPMCDIRGNEFYYPQKFEPVHLQIQAGDTVWLSQYLGGYEAVQFGKGVHIQGLIEITDGVMDFNIGAVKSGLRVGEREDIPTEIAFGEYRWDRTLKGIADTLPQVKAEIEYTITDQTADGEKIPVFLRNQYIPEGHTVTEWYTHLNPQNDIWSKTTAAESDILPLYYKDEGKLSFYGADVPVEERENIWYFDTYRSGARNFEAWYNAGSESEFKPNFLLDTTRDNHEWACNIGNYGVATTYKMKVTNETSEEKYCSLVITAASRLIAYATDSDGNNSYAYAKDSSEKKVTDNMLSYLVPPNSTETFEFSIILPVNYNGGIKNELVITNENIQTVDFEEKEEWLQNDRTAKDYRVTEVTNGEPLNEAVGNAPEVFDGAKGSYEYLKGRDKALVRWCAWDGSPNHYFNLWGYVNTVYFLDESNEIVGSYEFPSLPCGSSYDGESFYVRTARDGIFVTSDGVNWEKTSSDLPNYVPYYDLERASEWAVPELEKGWDAGIRLKKHTRNGYNFKSPITREEFCNLAAETLGLLNCELTAGEEITFSDTTSANVKKLAALGVIKGYEDGTFRPSEKLTREMAAVILTRLAEVVRPDSGEYPEHTYGDATDISDWARDGVSRAYHMGIMNGVGGNLFDPSGLYSREQSAATMLRIYEKLL